jgi:UDP-glucose 4-epimerase
MIQLVTGGAGFIGSHLVASLIARGHNVIAFDNLSRGHARFLAGPIASGRCKLVKVDCADLQSFRAAARCAVGEERVTTLWHMAANSDIPAGVADPQIDLRDTFITTFNALVLMRDLEIPKFHFASSSAIYGDLGDMMIREDMTPCRPISNYGAMKLASEAQISATLHAVGRAATIFRFPNVIGAPATHGVIYDFIRKLKLDASRLRVLGDGTQQKPYMHVRDLIDAMHFIADRTTEQIAVYNIGPMDDGVTVQFIAERVRDAISPGAAIVYGTGNTGWIGDVSRFRYSIERLVALGWRPSMNSADAVCRALGDILNATL